jgi:hypothetical protein
MLVLITVVKLSQNAGVHGYDTFSWRNIKESSIILIICTVVVAPIMYIIEKITGKEIPSPSECIVRLFDRLFRKK